MTITRRTALGGMIAGTLAAGAAPAATAYAARHFARDRFSHHIGMAALALAELADTAGYRHFENLPQLVHFLATAAPSDLATYHAGQLSDALAAAHGGVWPVRRVSCEEQGLTMLYLYKDLAA